MGVLTPARVTTARTARSPLSEIDVLQVNDPLGLVVSGWRWRVCRWRLVSVTVTGTVGGRPAPLTVTPLQATLRSVSDICADAVEAGAATTTASVATTTRQRLGRMLAPPINRRSVPCPGQPHRH